MDYIVSHTPVWVIQSETFRRPENYGKEQNDSLVFYPLSSLPWLPSRKGK